MRLLPILILCCWSFGATAHAQNNLTMRDTIADYKISTLATVLYQSGIEHSVRSFADGSQFIAVKYNGSNFIVRNTCVETTCIGLRLTATIGGANEASMAFANGLNANYRYYKAFLDSNNVLTLERYRIGDFGDYRGNILVEITTFAQVIQQVAQRNVTVSVNADEGVQAAGKLDNKTALNGPVAGVASAHVSFPSTDDDGGISLFAGNALGTE